MPKPCNASNPRLLTLLLLALACQQPSSSTPDVALQVKSASTAPPANTVATAATLADTTTAAVARLTTPQYELELHRAIAFLPSVEGIEMLQAKKAHRFVVLDVSVKNVAAADVDMGQVLLSTFFRDEKGRTYSHQSKAVAAYTLDNPNPLHQAHYNALWGKLKPGEQYRTTAIGLEIPETVKKLTLSMRDDGDPTREAKRYEAAFAIN